jgi:hypothetical protein
VAGTVLAAYRHRIHSLAKRESKPTVGGRIDLTLDEAIVQVNTWTAKIIAAQ